MQKLAILFFAAVWSAAAQPSSGSTGVSAESSPPTAERLASTNQNLSDIQLGEQWRATCLQGRRSICGRVMQILPDGLVVESGYTNLLREPLTKSWLVPGTVTVSPSTNLVEGTEPDAVCVGLVFLTDYPKSRSAKVNRYDYVILRGYPAGEYTYTSVGTVQRTVRRFSASLDKAVKLNHPLAVPAGAK